MKTSENFLRLNMKTNQELRAFLQENHFMAIGHGEGYDTKICIGADLERTLLALVFDESAKLTTEEQAMFVDVYDLGHWSINDHGEPYWYKASVGEIGAIDVILITKKEFSRITAR